MDVSIPDSLTGFIARRVRSGGYPNADAFITDLVRSEAAVMEGVVSGEALPVDEHFDRRLEALLDVRNLLAEGYQPYILSDGTLLLFAQDQRSLRLGLAFTF